MRSTRRQELHPRIDRGLPRVLQGLERLSPAGERGVVMVVAADRKQARVIHRYARALLTRVPALKALVVRDVAEVIDLNNGISLEILTCSFRTVRGYTQVAALLDEVAFWKSDVSVSPDTEVLAAIKPSMASSPVRCCSVRVRPMRARVFCGRRTRSTSPRTVRPWWGSGDEGDDSCCSAGAYRRSV